MFGVKSCPLPPARDVLGSSLAFCLKPRTLLSFNEFLDHRVGTDQRYDPYQRLLQNAVFGFGNKFGLPVFPGQRLNQARGNDGWLVEIDHRDFRGAAPDAGADGAADNQPALLVISL